MSFTPNIVNIHRTILHVLELHLGRAGSKFWFTSLEHHKRGDVEEKEGVGWRLRGVGGGGEKEQEEDEDGTPAQVFLCLVESSIRFLSFLRPNFTFMSLISNTGGQKT